MAKDTRVGGNSLQPEAYPHLQVKYSKAQKVTTVASGKVVGQKVDQVGK